MDDEMNIKILEVDTGKRWTPASALTAATTTTTRCVDYDLQPEQLEVIVLHHDLILPRKTRHKTSREHC
jgi:hypothetical protein